MENPKISLEETKGVIRKALIGYQDTLDLRNRMVRAYTDFMNLQV